MCTHNIIDIIDYSGIAYTQLYTRIGMWMWSVMIVKYDLRREHTQRTPNKNKMEFLGVSNSNLYGNIARRSLYWQFFFHCLPLHLFRLMFDAVCVWYGRIYIQTDLHLHRFSLLFRLFRSDSSVISWHEAFSFLFHVSFRAHISFRPLECVTVSERRDLCVERWAFTGWRWMPFNMSNVHVLRPRFLSLSLSRRELIKVRMNECR